MSVSLAERKGLDCNVCTALHYFENVQPGKLADGSPVNVVFLMLVECNI